jgi:hypothetical protein
MANCNICGNFVPDAQYQVHAMSCFSSNSAPGVVNYQNFTDSFSKGFNEARRKAEENERAALEAKRIAEEQRILEDKFVLIAKGLSPDLAEANARNLARLKKLESEFVSLTSDNSNSKSPAFTKQKTYSQIKFFSSGILIAFLLLVIMYLGSSLYSQTSAGSFLRVISNVLLAFSLISIILLSFYCIYGWIQFMRSVDGKTQMENVKIDKFSKRLFLGDIPKLQEARLSDIELGRMNLKAALTTLYQQVEGIPPIPFLDLVDFRNLLRSSLD